MMCARCGEPKDAHYEVRWQWGDKCYADGICPAQASGFEDHLLPDGYFLPLLDEICFRPTEIVKGVM